MSLLPWAYLRISHCSGTGKFFLFLAGRDFSPVVWLFCTVCRGLFVIVARFFLVGFLCLVLIALLSAVRASFSGFITYWLLCGLVSLAVVRILIKAKPSFPNVSTRTATSPAPCIHGTSEGTTATKLKKHVSQSFLSSDYPKTCHITTGNRHIHRSTSLLLKHKHTAAFQLLSTTILLFN